MNCVVTGAASGIGLALAKMLVERGESILATDVDQSGLDAAAREMGWTAPRVRTRVHDVRDAHSWARLIAEAVESWERLDVVVNVAGVVRPEYVSELTSDCVSIQLDVNTKGVILGTQAAAAVMVRQKSGHIVNIASMAALAPIPGIAVYCASKFAVRGFTLAAASELRPHGIAVTCVYPDATQTPMLDYQLDYAAADMTFSGARQLSADEVAGVVVNRVLRNKPLEVMIPWHRGMLARLSMSMPAFLTRRLLDKMTRQGSQSRQRILEERNRPTVS